MSRISDEVLDEEWRLIAACPNYLVSNYGRVFSNYRGELLAQGFNQETGYLHVGLWNRGKQKSGLVHRLVAIAFIGHPIGKMDVNHLDGDKTYNFVQNLEWATRGDNHRHAYRTGLRTPVRHGMRTIRCVQTGTVFDSIAECALILGANSSSISNCLSGHRNSWHGLTFEYAA